MLGGGLGRLEGLHDLTSDALLSVRMITWDVTFIQASRTVNDNLFWGIRGAGQNFDVIVEALFETYPATNWCMQYISDLTFSADKLEAVLNVTAACSYPTWTLGWLLRQQLLRIQRHWR